MESGEFAYNASVAISGHSVNGVGVVHCRYLDFVVIDLNVKSASRPVVLPGHLGTIYHTDYDISVHVLGK